mmetsp:Transcript_4920/g.7501  ORF Transcript_4920/g.7501 Transcript_4920/m.7501 type:complete len:953 (-) Transcript_4920:33-2891(-)
MSASEVNISSESNYETDAYHQSESSGEEKSTEALLSRICALEMQNLKIRKCLGQLNSDTLNERILELEKQNKVLLDTAKSSQDIQRIGDVNLYLEINGEIDSSFSQNPQRIAEENGAHRRRSSKRRPSFGDNSLLSTQATRRMTRRTVGTSRFSLANRFSLDWADKDGSRRSFLPPAYDIYRGPHRQSIDIAINSMRLSINQPLQESDVNCNFLEFCVVGVKRKVLTGEDKPEMGSIQPAAILDNFPKRNQPFIECISDFAFPSGVFLHMTDSKRYAEILCKQRRDQYTVLQFSDSFGTPTYACCLVVTDAVPLHNKRHAKTIAALAYLERLERCAYVVKRFMRYAVRKSHAMYRREITNKAGMVVGYVSVKPVPSGTTSTEDSSSHGRQGAMEHTKSAKIGASLSKLKNTVKSRLNKGTHHSPRNATGCSTPERPRSGSDRPPWLTSSSQKASQKALECLGDVFDNLNDDSGNESDTSLPNSNSASHARATPVKPQKRHRKPAVQYVVTQRAYCILSAQPMHSALFQILEEISRREKKQCNAVLWAEDYIDSRLNCDGLAKGLSSMDTEGRGNTLSTVTEEGDGKCLQRQSSSTTTVSLLELSQGPDYGVGGESFTQEHRELRGKFLEYVQRHPMTPSIVNTNEIRLSFPSYIDQKIILPAQPVTMEEWASAVVLSIVNPSIIISVLNLLVLEKSLIVFGSNASMVSAVTTAVIGYLEPFQWQGVFIPLVPANAVEILQAPVPFVVGTCCEFDLSSIATSAAVLNLDRILDSNETRSKFDKALTMPDIKVMMPLDQELRATLNNAAKELSSRLPDDRSNLQLATFLTDITDAEKTLLKEVREAIEQHNQLFCGDLFVADGWRKYGTYDPSTGDFDFYPQWFLDHQRSILEFQDVVVHTQLFVSYVDKLRSEYIEKNSQRLFIADWLYFRYIQKKKRLRREQAPVVMKRRST